MASTAASGPPATPHPLRAANLPVVEEGTASSEVQQLYADFRKNFGRPEVPGILRCFATHPPLLRHMMDLAREMLFVDGALGRENKELVSTFVSATNHCPYCADSHAFAFRMQGGSAAATDAALACDLTSTTFTPQQRALLTFTHKLTEASHSITPADIDALRNTGWTDLQIAEAIHVTALFATFNRVVNAFGLPSQGLLSTLQGETADAR